MALILGGFVFTDYAIPEHVSLGGEHSFVVQRLIGGERVVDAMGPDDSDIHWSGRFQGSDALSKAMAIDQLRISGVQVPLVIDSQYRLVGVKKFEWQYERWYQIVYRISCLVVANFGGAQSFTPTLDVQVALDVSRVNASIAALRAG